MIHRLPRRALRDRYLSCTLLALLLATGLGPPAAAGQLPAYEDFQLQARSSFVGAFNLPDSAFFSNSTPALNDSRQVAIDLTVVPGSTGQGLWFGVDGAGSLVYTSPAGSFIFTATMNSPGVVAFDLADSPQDGIYLYDPGSGMTAFETNLPFGASGWGTPTINDSGEIGYRADFGAPGQAWVSYDGIGATAVHAAEVGLDPMSPYSFLFTPSFNGARQIAGKVRLGGPGQLGGSQPDEIRRFESDGGSALLAFDDDGGGFSDFSGFDNGVSLTDSGAVAFIADLAAGGRGVYLADGSSIIEIASTPDPMVGEIEFFAPAANDAGVVVFRGKDAAGLQALFVGDGNSLVRLIGEHDLIETDLGTARIDQHDGSPVFSGGPAINGNGDVAFAAGLTPPDDDQVEWGTGLFVARAALPIFSDGFEAGNTAAWDLTVP